MTRPLAMRFGALTLAFFSLILYSCKISYNRFIVRDPERSVISANLLLCGRIIGLSKTADAFRALMPATCEGEGKIIIRLSNREETVCRVGYVTPGAEQTFEFSVKSWRCQYR
jgi:hypothetical protein